MSKKNIVKGIKCMIVGHNYKPIGVHFVRTNGVSSLQKGNVKYCETCGSLLRTAKAE